MIFSASFIVLICVEKLQAIHVYVYGIVSAKRDLTEIFEDFKFFYILEVRNVLYTTLLLTH